MALSVRLLLCKPEDLSLILRITLKKKFRQVLWNMLVVPNRHRQMGRLLKFAGQLV